MLSVVLVASWGSLARAAGDVDPGPVAQGSIDDIIATLVAHGPVVGGMYVLYAIAASLVARYRSASWFAQGKRLAIAVSALGIASAALQARFVGSPWTVVLAAAVAAAFKLVTPTPTKSPLALASKKIAASAVPAAVVAVVLLIAVVSCTASQRQRTANGAVAALACEAPNVQNVVTQLLPALTRFVSGLILGDGAFDRDALRAAARPFRDTALQCAMDAAVAAAAEPSGDSIRGFLPDGVALAGGGLVQEWSRIRGELGWAPAAVAAGS